MRCSYCQEELAHSLTLVELFLMRPLKETTLCVACQAKFTRYPATGICYGCNRLCAEHYCSDCLSWQEQYPNYDFHHETLFHYDEGMQAWFDRYKFLGDYQLCRTFAEPIREYFQKQPDQLVIPLPLSAERFKSRGFNQVTALLTAAEVPFASLLEKKIDTAPQSKKNRQERMELTQPFSITDSNGALLTGKQVLLVDDIYTTGRTLFHAAELIRGYAPKAVSTFSLAR